tara:strand:- start:3016 stop:3180 length:165 start_codon:yes stop_codon:yes gene_type:complete
MTDNEILKALRDIQTAIESFTHVLNLAATDHANAIEKIAEAAIMLADAAATNQD